MLASLHPSDRPGPGTARRAWRASPSPHAAKTRPGASSTPCTVGASRRPREPLAAPTPTRPVVVVRVRRLARAARRPRPRCGPSERRHGLSPSRRACRGRATGAAHDVNRKALPCPRDRGNLKPRRAAYVQIHEAPVDDDGEVADWAEVADGSASQPAGGLQPAPRPGTT